MGGPTTSTKIEMNLVRFMHYFRFLRSQNRLWLRQGAAEKNNILMHFFETFDWLTKRGNLGPNAPPFFISVSLLSDQIMVISCQITYQFSHFFSYQSTYQINIWTKIIRWSFIRSDRRNKRCQITFSPINYWGKIIFGLGESK